MDKIPLAIGRFNKPLVVIKPFNEGDENDFMKFYGFMADAGDETGEDFVNRVRRSAREKRYVERLRNRNA